MKVKKLKNRIVTSIYYNGQVCRDYFLLPKDAVKLREKGGRVAWQVATSVYSWINWILAEELGKLSAFEKKFILKDFKKSKTYKKFQKKAENLIKK